MIATITPGAVKGELFAPASKSAMQRACALALLHSGTTVIGNPGTSNDDKAALSIIAALGAQIEKINDEQFIVKGFSFNENAGKETAIHCGESGLSIRMFTPIAALNAAAIHISGSGSLLTRPMNFFDEVLPQLSVTVTSQNGLLPLTVTGPLKPAGITIDGSLSSQFLTGLLIAFAKAAIEPVTLTVIDLKSKPYIDLTLQMMKHFGYEVQNNNYRSFTVFPFKKQAETIHYTVEGDWSGASFLLVAGAISGGITVKGLDVFSTQADRAILQVLMMTEASVSVTTEEVTVTAKKLKPFQFDATDCPDLFPPLVALAAYCDGTSVITGVSRLAFKESDRAITLQEEFAKLGIVVKLQDDLMLIEGGTGVHGARVHSRHDHRIAMALAIAALRADSAIIIEEAEAINKSYPDFYNHIVKSGVAVSLH